VRGHAGPCPGGARVAFVICQPGEALDFDKMIAFFKDQRIAAWMLPERLELREAFPMTPSGKIQKYQLREELARLLGQKPLIGKTVAT